MSFGRRAILPLLIFLGSNPAHSKSNSTAPVCNSKGTISAQMKSYEWEKSNLTYGYFRNDEGHVVALRAAGDSEIALYDLDSEKITSKIKIEEDWYSRLPDICFSWKNDLLMTLNIPETRTSVEVTAFKLSTGEKKWFKTFSIDQGTNTMDSWGLLCSESADKTLVSFILEDTSHAEQSKLFSDIVLDGNSGKMIYSKRANALNLLDRNREYFLPTNEMIFFNHTYRDPQKNTAASLSFTKKDVKSGEEKNILTIPGESSGFHQLSEDKEYLYFMTPAFSDTTFDLQHWRGQDLTKVKIKTGEVVWKKAVPKSARGNAIVGFTVDQNKIYFLSSEFVAGIKGNRKKKIIEKSQKIIIVDEDAPEHVLNEFVFDFDNYPIKDLTFSKNREFAEGRIAGSGSNKKKRSIIFDLKQISPGLSLQELKDKNKAEQIASQAQAYFSLMMDSCQVPVFKKQEIEALPPLLKQGYLNLLKLRDSKNYYKLEASLLDFEDAPPQYFREVLEKVSQIQLSKDNRFNPNKQQVLRAIQKISSDPNSTPKDLDLLAWLIAKSNFPLDESLLDALNFNTSELRKEIEKLVWSEDAFVYKGQATLAALKIAKVLLSYSDEDFACEGSLNQNASRVLTWFEQYGDNSNADRNLISKLAVLILKEKKLCPTDRRLLLKALESWRNRTPQVQYQMSCGMVEQGLAEKNKQNIEDILLVAGAVGLDSNLSPSAWFEQIRAYGAMSTSSDDEKFEIYQGILNYALGHPEGELRFSQSKVRKLAKTSGRPKSFIKLYRAAQKEKESAVENSSKTFLLSTGVDALFLKMCGALDKKREYTDGFVYSGIERTLEDEFLQNEMKEDLDLIRSTCQFNKN